MKETSWQEIHNPSTLVRNTSEFGRQGLPKLWEKASIQRQSSLEQQLHPRRRLWDAPCARAALDPSNSAGSAFWATPFPEQGSVLCAGCTWLIQTSTVSHIRNLMGNTTSISSLQGEVLRYRKRRKLEEVLTLIPKAEWKRISQLFIHFSKQWHYNSQFIKA